MGDYQMLEKQLPCANANSIAGSQNSPCLEPALNVCNGCLLVQYCSRGCQLAHWNLHKRDCKSPLMRESWKPSWEVEKRKASFIGNNGPIVGINPSGAKKQLWGNVPAIDIFDYKRNEEAKLPNDLNLLFAASGDIRNFVKSLAELPESYRGRCGIIINDRDFDIVARNTILLLIALYFEPVDATHMMLHIWYSALIPNNMLRALQDRILPLILEVCAKIRERPSTSLQSKLWRFGRRSLRLVLQKSCWDRLPSYLMVPADLSMSEARNLMVSSTLAPDRKDYRGRALYMKPPPWRVCNTKFRRDGVLLPFGLSRDDFNMPNPTLYHTKGTWPMKDSADPLDGWPVEEVIQKLPLAKNDIYGGLCIYIQDILLAFCRQVKSHRIILQLFHVEALELPEMIFQLGPTLFDRIEVSNIADRSYLGPKTTLSTFGPLLKRKSQNPHATLLTLFMNATLEASRFEDHTTSFKSEVEKLSKYLPRGPAMLQTCDTNSAEFLKCNEARFMFRDFDKDFRRFDLECQLEKVAKAAGLKRKPVNTIVEPWPMRLKANATQEEFNNILASGHTGAGRYVEWESLI